MFQGLLGLMFSNGLKKKKKPWTEKVFDFGSDAAESSDSRGIQLCFREMHLRKISFSVLGVKAKNCVLCRKTISEPVPFAPSARQPQTWKKIVHGLLSSFPFAACNLSLSKFLPGSSRYLAVEH